MAKKIVAGVAVVLGFLVGLIMMQPASTQVNRTVDIQATPAQVWPHLIDLKKFVVWSPWSGMDPSQKVTFEGPATGVGSSYMWQGNDQVGKGKMTITKASEPTSVTVALEFIEPFESKADVGYKVTAHGATTTVMWWYESPNNFMAKAMCLVMDMDKMLGAVFAKGLASLKKIVEDEAKAAPPPAAAAAVAAPDAGPPTAAGSH